MSCRAVGFPCIAESRHLGGFLRVLAPEFFQSVMVQVAKPCRSEVLNRFRELSFLGQLQNFPFDIACQGSRFLGRVPWGLGRLDGSGRALRFLEEVFPVSSASPGQN